MPVFSYRALAQDGSTTTGTMAGESEALIILGLRRRGLTPLEVRAGQEPLAAKPSRKAATGPRPQLRPMNGQPQGLQGGLQGLKGLLTRLQAMRLSSGVGPRALVAFADNLGLLLSSGIALDKSLVILRELADTATFREVLDDLHVRVREGQSLGDALAQHPRVFPAVFISMVGAGERGGVLEAVLGRLTEYLQSVQEVREYLVSAMIYPVILSLTAGTSAVVLLTVVMPRFAGIFHDLGAALPPSTKILLGLGNFLSDWWWLLILAGAGLAMGGRMYARTRAGRLRLDEFKLRAPILGSIFARIEVARFARTLSTLLSNGVPMLSALNIVRGVIQNQVFLSRVDATIQEVKEGGQLSTSLSSTNYIPSLATHMIGVGEQTGRLDVMLGKVADVFDKELKVAIKSFTSFFEPAIILVLGLLIGVMVVSILSAIFSINEIGM